MSSHSDFILANARVVLADAVIERGWVAVADGRIAEVGEGTPPERSEDLVGDLLIPGLVVIVAVLAFNLVGDGLRDAADPYSH